jgi:hypothetical protein
MRIFDPPPFGWKSSQFGPFLLAKDLQAFQGSAAMKLPNAILALSFSLVCAHADDPWVVFKPKSDGPGKGKHVVFLAGDEEYRSEEGLPMLARILSERHGFKCTVCFSVNAAGEIDPEAGESLTNPAALDSADAIVMLLRFRHWKGAAMEHFEKAFHAGKPIIGLRTSTHAFKFHTESKWKSYNKFGENVLGEEWISHWGRHKKEGSLGVVEAANKDHAILNGVGQVFGDSDVYEAYPPNDASILMRGKVLEGMTADTKPAKYTKRRRSDNKEQDVNGPAMPVAWIRIHKHDSGKSNKIFNTTLGASTDLQSEGLRRMVVNSVFWGLDLDVPDKANVDYVGKFRPIPYGFGSFEKGVKPSRYAAPQH